MSGGGGNQKYERTRWIIVWSKRCLFFFCFALLGKGSPMPSRLGSPMPNRLVKEIPHAASQQQVILDAAQNR